jgi:hypothetical protein
VNKANNNLQQRSAKDINAEYDWHGSDAIDGKIVREGDVTYVNKISNKGKIDCHIMTKDVSIAPEFKEYTRLDSYAKAQFRQYELSFKFDKHIKFYRESRDDALQIIKFSNHKTGQKGKIFIDSDTVLVRYETNIPQAKKIKQNKYSYQLKSGIGVCGYVKTPQGYVFDFGEIEAKSELQKSACLHFLLIRSVWKLKKISNDAIPRNIKVRSLFSKEIYDLK